MLRIVLAGLALLLAPMLAMPALAQEGELAPMPVWPAGVPAIKDWPGLSKVPVREELRENGEQAWNVTVPTLQPFLPDPAKATGMAVVIAPGGGFRLLAIHHEGTRVARWLAAHGIAAFVLKYRLIQSPPGETNEAMRQRVLATLAPGVGGIPGVEDGMEALRIVRANAAKWKIDPHRVGVMGFSAGGHVAGMTMAALKAGKHVLVEKPAAETGEDALALAREAEARGLVLAVGHTFRHNEAVRQVEARMPSLGRLLSLEVSMCVRWDGPQAPWWAERKAQDGLILSLFAPHALDFVQLVMGADDPVRVYAEAARLQSGWQGEDEAMIVMAYPGRRMASVHTSYNQPTVQDRKTLYFETGILEIEHGEILRWNDEVIVMPPAEVLGDPRKLGGRGLSHYFEGQIEEFAKAVRGQPHRMPTGYDAARLITLIDRVRASARANSAADSIDPLL